MLGSKQTWASDSSNEDVSKCNSAWNGWRYGGRVHGGYKLIDVSYITNSAGVRTGLLIGEANAYADDVEQCFPRGSYIGGKTAPSTSFELFIRLSGTSFTPGCGGSLGVPSGITASCTVTFNGTIAEIRVVARCAPNVDRCDLKWKNLRIPLGPQAVVDKRWWQTNVVIHQTTNFGGRSDAFSVL